MQSDNSPTQERVSAPKHLHRLSDWSQTRWQRTTLSVASLYVQKWFLPLQKPHSRIAGNEDSHERFSKARLCRRIERIQIHSAYGNGQDIVGMPVHRRTIQETPGMYGGSALPLPGVDGCSCRQILHVGLTCVKWIPRYHFIVAIEACIDLCNHLISRNSFRVPEDYGDTFRVMAEVGALSPEFAELLVSMGKFRNRLVHLYWEVDDRQVHQFLCSRLQDFRRFLKEMAQYLALCEIAE